MQFKQRNRKLSFTSSECLDLQCLDLQCLPTQSSTPSTNSCQGVAEDMSKDIEDPHQSVKSSCTSNDLSINLQKVLERLVKDSNGSLSINYFDGAFVVQTGTQEVKSASLQEALDKIQCSSKPSVSLPENQTNLTSLSCSSQLSDFSNKTWSLNPKQYLMFLFDHGKIDFNLKQTNFDYDPSGMLFVARVELTNGQTVEASARSKKEAERLAVCTLLSQLERSLGSKFEIEKAAPSSGILSKCYQPIQANSGAKSNLVCAYYASMSGNKGAPKVLLEYDGNEWFASIEYLSRQKGQEVRQCRTSSKRKTEAYKALVEMLHEFVLNEIYVDESCSKASSSKSIYPASSNSTDSRSQFDVSLSASLSEQLAQFLRNNYQYTQNFSSVESLPVAEEEVDFIPDQDLKGSDFLEKKSQELKKKSGFNFDDYPIKRYQDEILSKIDANQVVIDKGSAGCGKTTQVPSYLLHQYSAYNLGATCNVIVSEPRKIAAKNAAIRVAEEWNEPLGGRVGYNVRFDKQLPEKHGSIMYCTNGVLLRMLTIPSKIRTYFSHIILDEVHERSVEIDLLLLAAKTLLRENPDLRLVLMSGTIDCQVFQDYFSSFKVEVVTIEQEIYPIECCTLEQFVKLPADYLKFTEPYSKDFVKSELFDFNPVELKQESIPYELIAYILNSVMSNPQFTGDVLIFLPGWEHIQTLFKMLEPIYLPKNIELLVMHSMIGQEQHDLVFARSTKRRIILSTNIAESSITIESVNVVIDTLKEKKPVFEHDTRIRSFKLDWISQKA